MFGLRSAQGRAKVAILVLLVLLVGLAALATWHAQKERGNREALGQRAAVVAALEDARAQLYRGATLLTAAVFAEDATPFTDSYRQAQEVGDKSLEKARSTLAAMGETDQIAALDSFAERMNQLRQEVDSVLVFAATADRPTRVELGLQYYPQMWPKIEVMLGELGALSSEQQAALVAEGAAADRASETSLIQLIGFGAFAILGGAATVLVLVGSIVRPLASLQVSARAVASGNLEARAKVAGPEEVASLAHDFNEMTDALVERSAQLQESEQHFRYVLDVSRDFIYKSNLQTGTYDYVSPSVFELTGFTPEEVVAMGLGGVAERIHPEDGKRLTGEIKNLTKDWDEGQRSAISVYRSKHKDGEYRWFSDNSVFVRYSNEQPATMIGAIRDITAQKQAEEALRESEHDLKERAKELNCLYGISNLVQRPDISLEEILQGTANLIPPAWQYPEITCARIVLGGQQYLSGSFRETAWRQTSDIIVNGERIGAVEVCYLEEKPESDEGPFLTEERGLINAIAERVGRVVQRRQVEQALAESEERFRSIFESIQDVFYRTDGEGIITEISPSIERFGYSREALIGTQVLAVYEDPEERSGLLKTLLEQGDVADHEIRLKTGDGRLLSISVSAHILRGPDGTLSGVEGTLRDISERKRLYEKLEVFSNAVEGAYDSFVMVDMNGNVVYANESAVKTFGYSLEEMLKLNVAQFAANPEDAMKVIKEVETKGSYDGEVISIGKKKEAIPVLLSVSVLKDSKGNPTGMMGVYRDITERKRAEEALHEQARRDPLTGVLNHGAIVDEMRSLISDGELAAVWAVAMIDVDGLKVTNDTYGHQVGDALLVAVATALSRDDALVGRYGGDEFVAILPSADRNAAAYYRNQVMDALGKTTVSDPETGATVSVGASIGLAMYPEDGRTIADLIKFSDVAMYAAKRQRPFRRPHPRKPRIDRKAA